MFIGVGVGAHFAGVLHLVTHAFFKACLFLGAGSVMHGMQDDTNIQNMGGLWKKMPHTAWTFLIATFAITGVVPLSGFFSKDAILAGAFYAHNAAWPAVGKIAYALGAITAAGTAFYMTRLFALTFAGAPRTKVAEHAHESAPAMTVPLWILAFLSVVAAVLALPPAVVGHHWGELFQQFTMPVFGRAYEILGIEEHTALWPFAVAWVLAIVPAALAWSMYAGGLRGVPDRLAAAFPAAYRFVYDKFRVDELYGAILLRPLRTVADALFAVVDRFAIEGILVNGIPKALNGVADVLRSAQNGQIQRYAAVLAVTAAVLLWVVLGAGG